MQIKISSDFEASAQAVLSYLSHKFGFGLWVITRKVGNQWIVIKAIDKAGRSGSGFGIVTGDALTWSDTLCAQMVAGNAPRIAPDLALEDAYASTSIAQTVTIGAYMGVPLSRSDGSLFGTLCAIDSSPQPQAIVAEKDTIELLGTLLSTVLESELKLSEAARRAERSEAEALTDSLTGFYNRRGWQRLLAAEEVRCRRYGHPAFILALDLDGLKSVNDSLGHTAGDALIQRAASLIKTVSRENDVLARLGGDEFVILGVESDSGGADALEQRLRKALVGGNVDASIGVAQRNPNAGLESAFELADQCMYADKRRRGTAARRARLASLPNRKADVRVLSIAQDSTGS